MNFTDRCNQPGVIRWFGFDSQADIQPFIYSGASTPVVDTAVKASGAGSILFTIPSNSAANTSGGFSINFTPGSLNYSDTDSYPVQFGEGGEFFIQWRQRFSQDFVTRYYKGAEGWKQTIIGTGDRTGVPAYSCTQLEVVTVNSYHRGFPEMYHSCGVKDGQYEGLDIPFGAYDYKLQNAVDGCNYTLVHSSSSRAGYIPPCIGYKADQWMTFQVHVKVGTWYKNDHVYHKDSWIQLWVAEEDKPSVLVIDRNPANSTGYDLVNVENINDKYGKIWLLPYNTGKDATEVHPTGYTWYDELIISRNKIPDPGALSTLHEFNHVGSVYRPEHIVIYDLRGRIIKKGVHLRLNKNKHLVMDDIPNGMYLMMHKEGSRNIVKRVMVGR